MTTVIRDAVIKLGIQQVNAQLKAPDLGDWQKTEQILLGMGDKANDAARAAGDAWKELATTIRNLKAEVDATADSFEKILADGVAWEETLPKINDRQSNAAGSARELASMNADLLGAYQKMGSSLLTATRGLLFLTGAETENSQAVIRKLFIVQGLIDLMKAARQAQLAYTVAVNAGTAASMRFIAVNAPLAALAAALAAIIYMAQKAWNAKSDAIAEANERLKFAIETSKEYIALNVREAEATNDRRAKLRLLKEAWQELRSVEMLLVNPALQAAEDEEQRTAALEQAVELEKQKLELLNAGKQAHQQIAQEAAKAADALIRSLQTSQQIARIEENRAAQFGKMNALDKAKTQGILSQLEKGGVGSLRRDQLEFLSGMQGRPGMAANAEFARRGRQTGFEDQFNRVLPLQRDEAVDKAIKNLEAEKAKAANSAAGAMKELDKVAKEVLGHLRAFSNELSKIRAGRLSK